MAETVRTFSRSQERRPDVPTFSPYARLGGARSSTGATMRACLQAVPRLSKDRPERRGVDGEA
jgi:hypothetical protein